MIKLTKILFLPSNRKMTQILTKNSFKEIDFNVKNIPLPLRVSLLAYIAEPFVKIARKKSVTIQNLSYKRKVPKISKNLDIKKHKFVFIRKRSDQICKPFLTEQPDTFKLMSIKSSNSNDFTTAANIENVEIKEDQKINEESTNPSSIDTSQSDSKNSVESPDSKNSDQSSNLISTDVLCKKEKEPDVVNIININKDEVLNTIDTNHDPVELNNNLTNNNKFITVIQPANQYIEKKFSIKTPEIEMEIINGDRKGTETDTVIESIPPNYLPSEILTNKDQNKNIINYDKELVKTDPIGNEGFIENSNQINEIEFQEKSQIEKRESIGLSIDKNDKDNDDFDKELNKTDPNPNECFIETLNQINQIEFKDKSQFEKKESIALSIDKNGNINDDQDVQINLSFRRAHEVADKLKRLSSLNQPSNYSDSISVNSNEGKNNIEFKNENNNTYLDYSSLYILFKKRIKSILES
jgi:hypothetical protein